MWDSVPGWGTIDFADEERAGRLVALDRAHSDPGQDVRGARRRTRVLRAALLRRSGQGSGRWHLRLRVREVIRRWSVEGLLPSRQAQRNRVGAGRAARQMEHLLARPRPIWMADRS